jgi:mRNA interferase RelE/StbE
MTFDIFYDTQPQKFLKKSEKALAKRIMDKFDQTLKNDPVPHNAVPIVGEHGSFRVRVGKYRALYRVDFSSKKIIVYKIDIRDRVY